MNKFCIVIPTTDIPVELVSITQEAPNINSVLCLKNSFQALPISAAYDAFIRRPTGIIQKLFGDKSYRTDLSAPITQGQSWQLGVAIGHLAHHYDQLTVLDAANPNHDILIFTTGRVLPNLDIARVDHIEKKTHLSENMLINYQQQGGKVFVIMHPDNILELAFNHFVADKIIACSHLSQVSTAMGLELSEAKAPVTQPNNDKKRSLILPAILAAILMLFSATLITDIFIPYSDWKKWRLLEEDGQHIALSRSIKKSRRDGNWLQANTAILFEQTMLRKAAHVKEMLNLSIIQNDCPAVFSAKINSNILPSNINLSCPIQIQIVNSGEKKLKIWLRNIHSGVNEKKTTPPHGTTLEPGQTFLSPTIFLSSKNDLVALFATDRPSEIAQQWLINLNTDQRIYSQATARFGLAGIGLKVLYFAPLLEANE